MKSIILAAGKGTRLGNLTNEIPKPMLPINGKPLLEYIVLYLKNNGIIEIGINLFTMSEQIVEYFGDGEKWDLKIHYSFEDRLLGTAGSIVKFEEWLKDEEKFLVIYGDILTNQSLKPLIELHKKNNTFATLLLHRRKKSNSFVCMNEISRIVSFLERPSSEKLNSLKNNNTGLALVNSGVQVLSIDVLDYIKENQCFDLPKDVYSKVLNDKKIYGLELTGDRIAIDSPVRYEQAKQAVKQGLF